MLAPPNPVPVPALSPPNPVPVLPPNPVSNPPSAGLKKTKKKSKEKEAK